MRRFVIKRTREDLHAYAATMQNRQGVPIEAVVATYLHGEMLFALLHSGAAPWIGITAGAALQRAYASSRWHPDLELVTDQVPGAREMERWHECIEYGISKAYGLKWIRTGIPKNGSSTVFMEGELAWQNEPLSEPIRVRLLRTPALKTKPLRINNVHEVTPLPLADMILQVEPVDHILARTVMGMSLSPLSVARCIYDLSILRSLSARPKIDLMRDDARARGESIEQARSRLSECVDLIDSIPQEFTWTDYLACELGARPLSLAQQMNKELLASGTELIRSVAASL